MYKKPNKHKEVKNQQLSEIRKTVQDMKEIFFKNTEILKKNQAEVLEMKSLISQITNSVKNLFIRGTQIEDRISKLGDKVHLSE
jgi:glycine cleavage system regulatory protein